MFALKCIINDVRQVLIFSSPFTFRHKHDVVRTISTPVSRSKQHNRSCSYLWSKNIYNGAIDTNIVAVWILYEKTFFSPRVCFWNWRAKFNWRPSNNMVSSYNENINDSRFSWIRILVKVYFRNVSIIVRRILFRVLFYYQFASNWNTPQLWDDIPKRVIAVITFTVFYKIEFDPIKVRRMDFCRMFSFI